MSRRDDILRAVRRNRPPAAPLPSLAAFGGGEGDLRARFAEAVIRNGGEVTGPDDAAAALAERLPDGASVAAVGTDVVPATVDLDATDDPHDLAGLDLLVCRAVLGVAENGAVWLPESRLGHRAAPFLAQHLAVVLDAADLVATMHDAYARLAVDAEGFGLFLAGPSKTADIEQSLVIGAHGARSLTVVLVG